MLLENIPLSDVIEEVPKPVSKSKLKKEKKKAMIKKTKED